VSPSAPALVITGSSGFVGRHLIDALKEDHRIYGLARRSQARSGAPVHPNVVWYQVDIADRRTLDQVFRDIQARGGADTVIHLAAHYDFTGEEHPEYERTNVTGTRNVLDACRAMGIRQFLFSSSTAACAFPRPGEALTENSPPDGEHIYARTKRIGEGMLAEYAGDFHSVIVRYAALFSDWCEYPPLFMFINTWVSSAWNARMLGGKGNSAIPYLHVRELPGFFLNVLDRIAELPQGQVLIASPDGAVSHRELYAAVTHDFFGTRREPVLMPRALCGPGMQVLDVVGRLQGERPFERPWMARYIDQRLTIDSRRTRRLIGWEPRPRLEILRRMPFLIENLKTDPIEWNRRNRAAMKWVRVRSNLLIHQLLEKHEQDISDEYTRRLTAPEVRERFASYQTIAADQLEWNHRLILRHLMNAVRTRERAVFVAYCRDLAERRFQEGFAGEEVVAALETLNQVCFEALQDDPESEGLRERIFEHVTMTLRVGIDQVQEVFEDLEAARSRQETRAGREAVPLP
jgi:nucleoside-diphosphate-sugar epimerase